LRTLRQFPLGRPVSWSLKFDGPIPLPGGRTLVTLRDAGQYIAKLPKRQHDSPEWLAFSGAVAASMRRLGTPQFRSKIRPPTQIKDSDRRAFD
jgi:hypothetical protein